MSGEFLGTFENAVNKQRIIIPAELRKKFSAASKQTIIATIGPYDNIAIYPLDNWSALRERLRNGSEDDRELLSDLRDSATPEQKLESPYRIRLSDELLEIAGIDSKVILKGDGDYISVWSPEAYRRVRLQRLEARKSRYKSSDYQI
ncbi:MAG: protein MraZ [Candidatus Cloacimonetes bacterium]|nr:protein MraZ [Candidatus Cloacimonadota bacterium]